MVCPFALILEIRARRRGYEALLEHYIHTYMIMRTWKGMVDVCFKMYHQMMFVCNYTVFIIKQGQFPGGVVYICTYGVRGPEIESCQGIKWLLYFFVNLVNRH
jgi:hypothetical protein